jgi:(1->4)-alpha-D-glucan 1-alpha-D-glucosylmutase
VTRFAEGVLADAELSADLARFVGSIEPAARRTSLSRTLVKLTAPGVPDLYQGTELWETSLVDPDNRRPVDYAARRALLQRAKDASPEVALQGAEEGLPKLWLIHRVLNARKRHPEWFEGAYRRVEVRGEAEERVIAFARGDALVTLAPRWTAREGRWGDTELTLPPGPWVDVLSGETYEGGPLKLERAWSRFPVALLARRT